jgi:hypothetical protein
MLVQCPACNRPAAPHNCQPPRARPKVSAFDFAPLTFLVPGVCQFQLQHSDASHPKERLKAENKTDTRTLRSAHQEAAAAPALPFDPAGWHTGCNWFEWGLPRRTKSTMISGYIHDSQATQALAWHVGDCSANCEIPVSRHSMRRIDKQPRGALSLRRNRKTNRPKSTTSTSGRRVGGGKASFTPMRWSTSSAVELLRKVTVFLVDILPSLKQYSTR